MGFRSSTIACLAAAMTVLSVGAAAAQVLGAVLDEESYETVQQAPPLSRGVFAALPPEYSLKAHAPSVGQQGGQGSCVGWASAYAARTILAKSGAEDSANLGGGFSPAYVYNQIRVDDCDGGSRIMDALDLMSREGVAPLASFPYDERNCSVLPNAKQRAQAGGFRIGEWRRLFGSSAVNRHVPVRRALAAGHPVVIGMQLPNSFAQYDGGVFHAREIEHEAMLSDDREFYAEHIMGGHAMTVIGYNDQEQWIEVINSWGRTWGENGYVRIAWKDFNTFVVQAYEVIPTPPPPPPAPEPVAPVEDMHIGLRFLDMKGQELPARVEDGVWRLSKSLPSGARFRVEATTGETAYVYVLGLAADGSGVALFPHASRQSALSGARETMLLPGPTENHYTRLDDTTGKDTYLVVISRNRLDVDRVLAGVTRDGGGSLGKRLSSYFGDRLVRPGNLRAAGQGINVAVASEGREVVALPVVIDHVAPDPAARDTDPPLIVLTSPSHESFDDAADAPYVVSSSTVTIDGRAQDAGQIASVAIEGALSMRHSSLGPFRAALELPPGPGPHSFKITATDVAGNTAQKEIRLLRRN
ncbi:MAG: C1 family peptidase [Pseudodonghicola sp.]